MGIVSSNLDIEGRLGNKDLVDVEGLRRGEGHREHGEIMCEGELMRRRGKESFGIRFLSPSKRKVTMEIEMRKKGTGI